MLIVFCGLALELCCSEAPLRMPQMLLKENSQVINPENFALSVPVLSADLVQNTTKRYHRPRAS